MKSNLKFLILFSTFVLLSCYSNKKVQHIDQNQSNFNLELYNELERMEKYDQLAASWPEGKYKSWPEEKWQSFKDSIFEANQKRAKVILDKYGFVGYDLVGFKGSLDFWVIAQHSDHNPEFQQEVLEKMKIEVDKGNASSSCYAYLIDRVKINTNNKQIYGTQVTYNEKGQAYPKPLEDSVMVNERRREMGLEPLIDYLNDMTKNNFKINRAQLKENGINKPVLYKRKKLAGNIVQTQ